MKTKLNSKKNPLVIVMLSVTAIFLFAFVQDGPWVVPANYKSMKNPTTANATNNAVGKALFNKHCKSCHGTMGLGDGTKSAMLKTDCGDFSSKAFQAQTDGALFYKTTEGRNEMPSFKKTIPDDEDRWFMVNYMRTLKK